MYNNSSAQFYIGVFVYYTKTTKFFCTKLLTNNIIITSRFFLSEVDCAKCYDNLVVANYKNGLLNFPQLHPEYVIRGEVPNNYPLQILVSCDIGETHAIVSAEDYNRVVSNYWKLTEKGVVHNNILMHRLITGSRPRECVYHINGLITDNRRENLTKKRINNMCINLKGNECTISNYIPFAKQIPMNITDNTLRLIINNKEEKFILDKSFYVNFSCYFLGCYDTELECDLVYELFKNGQYNFLLSY